MKKRNQFARGRRISSPKLIRILSNAMIGPGNMRDLFHFTLWHVTAGAVWIHVEVGGRILRRGVACQTLLAIKGSLLLGRRRIVRVVAIHARHAVSADPLAFAQTEFFNLADAAAHHAVVS